MLRKLFIILFIVSGGIQAQSFHERDSLKAALKKAPMDINRYHLLEKLIYEYFLEDPKTALNYSQQLSELAQQINYPAGIAIGYSYEAYFYSVLGETDKALEYNLKSIPILEKLDSMANIGNIYGNIAAIYAGRGEVDKAIQYNYKAMQIKMESGDTNSMAFTLGNIGKIYYDQHQLKEALRCYTEGLHWFLKTGYRRGIASSLRYLGIVLNSQDRLYEASALSWHAYKMYATLKDKSSMAYCLNTIASVFKKQKNFSSAFHYYELAIQLSNESGEKKVEAIMKLEMAKAYFDQRNSPRAEKLLLESLDLFEEVKNKAGISEVNLYLGKLSLAKGDMINATQFFEKSYQLAEELKYPRYIMESSEKLYVLYKQSGHSDLALAMHERFHAMEDSIENDEGRQLLMNQKEKFEAYREKLDQERVEENNKRTEERRIERRNLLQYSFILLFILLIFSMVMFSGKIKFSKAFAEGLIFVSLLFLFEFILVLIDPFVDGITHGIPVYKLLINSVVALSIFPIHRFFEKILNRRVVKKQSN